MAKYNNQKPKCTAIDLQECFNCPFPDCIAGYREIKLQDAYRVEQEGKKKPDWVAGRVNRKIKARSSKGVRYDKGRNS